MEQQNGNRHHSHRHLHRPLCRRRTHRRRTRPLRWSIFRDQPHPLAAHRHHRCVCNAAAKVTARGACEACQAMSDDNRDRERARKASNYKKNRERLLIKAEIYRANNKDKIRESHNAWRLKNKEALKKKHREYHAANKEKRNKRSKSHRLENLEKYNTKLAQYRLKHREKLRNQAREYYHDNKQKRAAYAAEYRKANKEKIQAYWRSPKGKTVMMNAMHRRRSRISKTSTVTSSEMLALKRKAKSCYYCGIKTKALTFDHIQPISKEGTHTLDNLIMACAPCNSQKSAKDPHIFARQVGLLLI